MAEDDPIDYTPLSSAKQNRILIWRDEVASAALPSTTDTTSSSSDAASSVLAPSATNTTSSSSSQHNNRHHHDASLAAASSRRSRLWRRLSRHLPRLGSVGGAAAERDAVAQELRLREEMRTGMYAEAAQGPPTGLEGELAGERIARAQRLLDDGVAGHGNP